MERKYSVSEIDRMRTALRRKNSPLFGVQYAGDSEFAQRMQMIQAQAAAARNSQTEEELRTYMMAGVDPEELE